MLCLWRVCPGNEQIRAVTTAWKAMASPCLMKSDFATTHLSRGGCSDVANFSPPVAPCPDPWPWPWSNNPAVRLWFVRPSFAGASCRILRHGTPPAFFAASSMPPVQSAVTVSTDLSGPLHLRSPSIPSHPIQVATPSIVRPAVPNANPVTTSPGRRQDWVVQQNRPWTCY